MRTKKLLVGVAGVAGAICLGTGVAFAAWSATGSGTGVGAALSAQALTAAAPTIGSNGASLYPGGPAGRVYLQITNPNPYNVVVTGVSWGTPTTSNTSLCPDSNVSLDPSAPTSIGNPTILGNSTSSAIQVLGVVDMVHSAPDGCQGVTVDIPVTLTGTQS